MKVLVAALAVSISGLSYAAQNSELYDLQYLPNAGTVYGISGLSYGRYSDTDFTGGNEIKTQVRGPVLSQSVGFAVLDNFTLSGTLSYSDIENKTTGEDTTTTKGLGDLQLDGRYRLTDSTNRLDLLSRVTLSPGDSEFKSNGDSNNYTGGHSVGFGAEYGAKLASHQWSVSALYNYNLKSTTDDNGTKFKDDAHSSLEFAANLLTKLSEKSSIRSSVGVDLTEEYDDDNNGTTFGSTIYTVGAQYQYLVSKDVLAIAGANALMGGNSFNYTIMFYNVSLAYQF
jgi:hypothetical protein